MWIIYFSILGQPKSNKLTKHSLAISKVLPIISAMLFKRVKQCLYNDGNAVKSEKLIQF